MGFRFIIGFKGINGIMTRELRVESKTRDFGWHGGKWAAGQRETLKLGF